MWSGPRNISTALMRAWENRPDTFVTDEPFYAFYLSNTDIEHPGQKDILASQSTDWQEVVTQCQTLEANGCTVHYQKHMTHHILPQVSLEWLAELTNIFLIRSPAAVVASYSKARPDLTASDLGFEQQAQLFNFVKDRFDIAPLVIDSTSLLQQPRKAMEILCTHCGIAFHENMLSWPAGKRLSDGAWAPYWYGNVEASTGFSAPSAQRTITLDKQQQKIADACQIHYDAMAGYGVQF